MRKFMIICAFVIGLIICTFLYALLIGTKGLVVKEYNVINKLIDENSGMKIVHLSDIHFANGFDGEDLNKVVDEINRIEPDIVFFTGDLIEEDKTYDKQELVAALSKIDALLGKYFICGNHDLENDASIILTESGFEDLNNSYKVLYHNHPFIISGISSNIESDMSISDKVIEFNSYIESNKDIYSILLIHEPDYIDDLDLSNYDLILAGHSHGGQVRLPFIGKLYTPIGALKYYDEYYKVLNSDLYISSGLGNSSLPIRLFNRPSINFYRLSNK